MLPPPHTPTITTAATHRPSFVDRPGRLGGARFAVSERYQLPPPPSPPEHPPPSPPEYALASDEHTPPPANPPECPKRPAPTPATVTTTAPSLAARSGSAGPESG